MVLVRSVHQGLVDDLILKQCGEHCSASNLHLQFSFPHITAAVSTRRTGNSEGGSKAI